MSLRSVLRKLILTTLFIGVFGSLLVVNAGLRGPGKYSGVVIFDRWDTCLLLSGGYITYVSDAVKEELRPYRNEAIQINASVVNQVENPGDALIHKYTIIGPAPQSSDTQQIDGVRIRIRSDFDSDHTIAFWVMIENSATAPIEIESGKIGPTLLGLKSPTFSSTSDGKSVAWITRAGLLNAITRTPMFDNHTLSFSYEIDPKTQIAERFSLNPGESKQVRVLFKLPPGPYQFLVGFGGGVPHEGKSLVSNAISFRVDESGNPTVDE